MIESGEAPGRRRLNVEGKQIKENQFCRCGKRQFKKTDLPSGPVEVSSTLNCSCPLTCSVGKRRHKGKLTGWILDRPDKKEEKNWHIITTINSVTLCVFVSARTSNFK